LIDAKEGLETWFAPNNIVVFWHDMKQKKKKNAFWGVYIMKWRKWYKFVSSFLFNITYPYLSTQRTPKVPIKYFVFEWSIYWLIVTNRCWKRDFHQIMIFVYVCSTWGIIELKTRFETWITRNDENGVILFYLYYLITLMASCAHNEHQMS
jgi:hypothetical protein